MSQWVEAKSVRDLKIWYIVWVFLNCAFQSEEISGLFNLTEVLLKRGEVHHMEF